MITLQNQNRFISIQKSNFGHGGHHDTPKKPKNQSKSNHLELGNHTGKVFKIGAAGLALFVGTLVVQGPKPERIARKQVIDSVGHVLPDSTLKRLVKSKTEQNRAKADSAKALIKRLGFDS